MSDPTYNRKQGIQKYWAMFQRERRKHKEANMRTEQCTVPNFEKGLPLLPQIIMYQSAKQYLPAMAVYMEMYTYVKDLYLNCEQVINASRENTRRLPGMSVEETRSYLLEKSKTDFDDWFSFDTLGAVTTIIRCSSDIKYMQKVRIRNLFPDFLNEKLFEQWNVSDKFPKLSNCDDGGDGTESDWCNLVLFTKYYNNILTLLEFVDTTCHRECKALEVARERQTAAFRYYLNTKREYGQINAKIALAIELRTSDGIDEKKDIEDWAKEFGFGIDPSYELLYHVVSTDNDNVESVCPDRPCLTLEAVKLRLSTDINPRKVSLKELQAFVGTKLRPSVEGLAAQSLSIADNMTKIHQQLADLTMGAFAECRSEFVSFINVWKTHYCNESSTVLAPDPPPSILLTDNKIFADVVEAKSQQINDLQKLQDSYQEIDDDRAQQERELIDDAPVVKKQDPLRKIWTKYQRELKAIKEAQEESRRQLDEEKKALRDAEAREKLAIRIADRLTDNIKKAEEVDARESVLDKESEAEFAERLQRVKDENERLLQLVESTEPPPEVASESSDSESDGGDDDESVGIEQMKIKSQRFGSEATNLSTVDEDGYMSDHGF